MFEKLKARAIIWEVRGILQGKRINLEILRLWLHKSEGGLKAMKWLQGKKTYIVVIVGVLVNGLHAMGYITEEHIKIINYILGFLGIGAVRSGISKAEIK